jgi:hypothetical protein
MYPLIRMFRPTGAVIAVYRFIFFKNFDAKVRGLPGACNTILMVFWTGARVTGKFN